MARTGAPVIGSSPPSHIPHESAITRSLSPDHADTESLAEPMRAPTLNQRRKTKEANDSVPKANASIRYDVEERAENRGGFAATSALPRPLHEFVEGRTGNRRVHAGRVRLIRAFPSRTNSCGIDVTATFTASGRCSLRDTAATKPHGCRHHRTSNRGADELCSQHSPCRTVWPVLADPCQRRYGKPDSAEIGQTTDASP